MIQFFYSSENFDIYDQSTKIKYVVHRIGNVRTFLDKILVKSDGSSKSSIITPATIQIAPLDHLLPPKAPATKATLEATTAITRSTLTMSQPWHPSTL
jgi:hypothetical protein